jgi:hypothetical protein
MQGAVRNESERETIEASRSIDDLFGGFVCTVCGRDRIVLSESSNQ